VPAPAHERRDVSVKAIGWFFFSLVVAWVLIHLTLYGLMSLFGKQTSRNEHRQQGAVATPELARTRSGFPAPRLQIAPRDDLRALRARENTELNSYGWVDKSAGVVRIPISRAMQLLTERGLPVRSTNQPEEGPSTLQLMQERAQRK
jgi:hypothetical protein